ncbi:non-homologous end joining protein Ku [Streptomyces sp. GS7]|uniref:non-homologous end joining protein Ku n=1 Tax=Streptomyces sp. GS7 TaxID=2692234 RepID=UPI00131867E1|nr:Ku protein [Streptomyces sp. GS7]QHC24236.1 Ku protein [Streptomyces sp. GS7]
MRSIWNGSISFGLVTIPVKTYSATDRTSSVSFVRIHEKDGAPVQYRKVCELDGEEVPNEEIGKGYQPPGDDIVVPITDDDLSRLPLPTAKTLAILSFVDPGEIDPLQLDKSYYLAPNGAAAARPYALLREALEHHRKIAIGKVAMRGRENLAMLRAYEGALVMHALLWPDQIRPADGVAPEDVKIRENELTLAETLMDSLGELDPAELHDDYRQAVEELVAAKLEGTAPAAPDTSGTSGALVIDLTAALEKSVRAARGGGSGTGSASVTPLRARGTAAEKAPAKRTATAAKPPAKAAKSGTAQRTARERTAAEKAEKAEKSAPAKRSAKAASTGQTRTAKAAASGAAAGSATKSTAKSTAKKPGRKAHA